MKLWITATHDTLTCVVLNQPLKQSKWICDIQSKYTKYYNRTKFLWSSINWLPPEFFLEPYVSRKLGSKPMLAYHQYKFWDVNLFTKATYVQEREDYIYRCVCVCEGGGVLYLNDDSYNFRIVYDNSAIWEGLVIDISGPMLNTSGNIYRQQWEHFKIYCGVFAHSRCITKRK